VGRLLAALQAGVVVAACMADIADPPGVAPGIVASTPAPGGQAVPRGAPLVVRFDRAMNQGTVTVSTSPAVGLGAKQWLSDRAVWVAPTAALPAATAFQVTVTGTAADGAALPGGTGFGFTTAATTNALPTAHPRILLAPGGATAPRTLLAGRLTAGDAAAVRFKEVIDDHLFHGATLISEYRPWWGALLGVLTGNAAYCTDSVARVDAYVAAAEADIAANRNPEIAGDSYLHVGDGIGDLALVWDWCASTVTASMRSRWGAFAQQAIWNVWHPTTAQWGTRSAPWTGWGTDNPRNNYYLSFVEATLLWGAAANGEHPQAAGWLADGRRRIEVELARTHTADTAGGGSLEGTGYGSAIKKLLWVEYLWQQSTGQRDGDLSSSTEGWIRYLVGSVVPGGDRMAPIGDQSRITEALFTDYQREALLALAELHRGRPWGRTARNAANTFLPTMERPEEWVFDFLYGGPDAGTAAPMPRVVHSAGTGHVFARTSSPSGVDATWLGFLAGPYVESHAHHDALSILVDRHGWKVDDGGLHSGSGLIQVEEAHALVMLEDGATRLRMHDGGSARLYALRTGPGYVHMGATIGDLYPGSGVSQERELVLLDPGVIVVIDRLDSGARNLTRRFQLPTPTAPTITDAGRRIHTGSAGDGLDVFRTYPLVATTSSQPYTALVGTLGGNQDDFTGGYRTSTVVTSAGRTEMVHVLATGGAVASASSTLDAGKHVVEITFTDGRHATVWLQANGHLGALRLRAAGGATTLETQLVEGVER
jgi:hypothetical protein